MDDVYAPLNNEQPNSYQNMDELEADLRKLKVFVDSDLMEKMATQLVKHKPGKTNQYTKIAFDKMLVLVHDFFYTVDPSFAIKFNEMMMNNSRIRVFDGNNIEKDKVDHFVDSEGFKLFGSASLQHSSDNYRLYLPYYGNMKDAYTYIHEISHTFTMPKETTYNSILLAEIVPLVFEKLFDSYLAKHELYQDIISHNNYRLHDVYGNAKRLLPIITSLQVVRKDGYLTNDLLKEYISTNPNFEELERIVNYNYETGLYYKGIEKRDVHGINKIMSYEIAHAVSTNFFYNYDKTKFKLFIDTCNTQSVNRSLALLGTHIDSDGKCLNANEIAMSINNYYGDNNDTRAIIH